MTVKILDGATYTIIRRASVPGQRDYVWVGDNGQEIELTEEEAADFL
ncbi:hypothetical protein [Mycetocola zhujimingii]|nr:hypothetical protein [Mycetocola zhujimingii]